MAMTAYSYNGLNGYSGNCSIVLASNIHKNGRKQKSNYTIINSSIP